MEAEFIEKKLFSRIKANTNTLNLFFYVGFIWQVEKLRMNIDFLCVYKNGFYYKKFVFLCVYENGYYRSNHYS